MKRLAAATAVLLAILGPAVPARADRPLTAHVWITTPDGSLKLSDQGTVAFGGALPPCRPSSSTPAARSRP
jgi:hypothetical protein